MAIVVDLDDENTSITLSNGKVVIVDVYDFSIVVSWPGDKVKIFNKNGQQYINNIETGDDVRIVSVEYDNEKT